MKKPKKRFNVDEHLKMISELAKGAPEPEEILAEFARGDFSSLDPDLLKEIEEREKKEKKKKIPRSSRKEIAL